MTLLAPQPVPLALLGEGAWAPGRGGRRLPRILVVDDEAMVRETLAPYLGARLHAEVRTARSGEEALQHLRREAFDVVLADQGMPGMSGVELMRTLRLEYPGTARVMVTGHRDASTREAAEQLAAVHGFVVKPYSLRRMVKLLRALIDDPAHRPAQRRFP